MCGAYKQTGTLISLEPQSCVSVLNAGKCRHFSGVIPLMCVRSFVKIKGFPYISKGPFRTFLIPNYPNY